MEIWLLDKNTNIDCYENRRFREVVHEEAIEFRFLAIEDFDLIVASDKTNGGQLRNKVDCLIPRLGSGATYFSLSAMRHIEQGGIFTLNPSRSIEVGRE